VHQMRGELIPLLPENVPVVNLRGTRTLHDVFRLRQFLRNEKPDVLLANVDHNNIAAALAKGLTGGDTKLVICQHNPISAGFHATVNWKHRIVPLCYRALGGNVDHVVAVSNGIAGEMAQAAGFPADKVSTIFNAVIGDDFADRAAEPIDHTWLLDTAVPREVPVFVNAGRLVEMKDHRNLLQAFALYRQTNPGRLVILGTGPMRDELIALSKTLEIADDVEFVGFIENPLPYMRLADAFVLSSRSEGFGNVLVEAMGCGTPVVATDCPHGPADILSQGEYGVLVQPQDHKALATGLTRVIMERHRWPAERLQLRAASFSYERCADSYWRLFQQLI
jgi:glycosyltransferase involved in cell wall biosynthesis